MIVINETKNKKLYTVFIILFISLNIINTFIITTQTTNRYIVPFDYSFMGIINSMIGNLTVITFIMVIVGTFIKNPKIKLSLMLFATFILNFALFGANIYNRYYGTSFTLKALSIFQNPSEGFGLTIAFEAFKELITYYRIILFIPTIILGIFFIVLIRKNYENVKFRKRTVKTATIKTLAILLLLFANLTMFNVSARNEKVIGSAKATYATQNIGIYQYIFLEALGYNYDKAYNDYMTNDEVYNSLNNYNKNKDEYSNIFTDQKFSRNLKIDDIANIEIDNSLLKGKTGNDLVTGLLEDYNLVLIHLESFNHFLLDMPEVAKHLPNMKSIMDESYVFNNFYTNVGLGNSFDAEVSIMTGLNANGTSTLAWDYNSSQEATNYNFQSVPKMFLEKDYKTQSIHGNTGQFYNREAFHPEVFGIMEPYFKENFIEDEVNKGSPNDVNIVMDMFKEKYEHDAGMWISDRLVYERMNEQISYNITKQQKFFMYAITMLPHTPYHYDPYHLNAKGSLLYDNELIKKLDAQTIRYINYMKYYNEMFRVLFEDVNGYDNEYVLNEDKIYNHKETAYIFYGDHGSGISKVDLDKLYNKKHTALEARKELLQTTAFIYVPGKELNDNNFRKGLLKGEQNLVRGQTDLFRTITDLFNLPIVDQDYYFGVHGMSKEPTFSIDNRTGDVVTDYFVGSMRNEFNFIQLKELEKDNLKEIKDEIIKFKLASDIAVNNNLFKDFKKRNQNK